jgi:phosphinothricin acetyltransferase
MPEIRTFANADFETVRKIYQKGIDTGNATFETFAPDWEVWDEKFLKSNRLVAVENHRVIGWTALMPVLSRPVYRGVCEVSVYVDPRHSGKG